MPGTESKDNKLWDKKLGKPDACRVFLHYYFLFHHFVSCIYDYVRDNPARSHVLYIIHSYMSIPESIPPHVMNRQSPSCIIYFHPHTILYA